MTLTPSSVSPSVRVVSGEPLSVTCGATCVPACSFSWTRAGASSPTSSTTLLAFSALTAGDAGTYTCTTTNTKGSATLSFQLHVDGA